MGVALVLALAALDAPPPAPVRIRDVSPVAGLRFGAWTATRPLVAHPREGDAARVAFTLPAGSRFQALRGHLHTERPAKLRVREGFTWPAGSRSPFDRYAPGTYMWVLAPRGDRYYDVWYRGRRRGVRAFVGKAPWVMAGRDVAEEVAPGVWTWWVEVEDARHRRGWLRFPDLRVEGVREAGR